jgi:hypothetical protein
MRLSRSSFLAFVSSLGVAVALYFSSGRPLTKRWAFYYSEDRPHVTLKLTIWNQFSAGLLGGGSHDSGTLSVDVPQTIRTSESKVVHATFVGYYFKSRKQGPHFPPPVPSTLGEIKGDVFYSFGLTGPETLQLTPRERQVRWLKSASHEDSDGSSLNWTADCSWIVSPREPGRYTLFTDGFVQTRDGKPITEIDRKTQEFAIEALTPLGLNAKQTAFLQIASIVVSLVGGITAFPFLKSFFERKKPEPPAKAARQIIITDADEPGTRD